MNLGLIGLGKMGRAIATRLNGHKLNIFAYDKNPTQFDFIGKSPFTFLPSPRAIAETCDITISIITDDKAVKSIYLGENGILKADIEGKLFIEMSTILPMTIQELSPIVAQHGAAIVDSPVLGSIQSALSGTLVALIGGETAHVDRARTLLDLLTRKCIHLGPAGSGNAMKLVVNLTMAAYLQSLAEGLAIGRSYNLDINATLDILSEAPTANAWLATKMNVLKGGKSDTTLDIRTLKKDVMCAIATGAVAGIPMPGATGILSALSAVVASGQGAGDLGELPRLYQESMKLSGTD